MHVKLTQVDEQDSEHVRYRPSINLHRHLTEKMTRVIQPFQLSPLPTTLGEVPPFMQWVQSINEPRRKRDYPMSDILLFSILLVRHPNELVLLRHTTGASITITRPQEIQCRSTPADVLPQHDDLSQWTWSIIVNGSLLASLEPLSILSHFSGGIEQYFENQ